MLRVVAKYFVAKNNGTMPSPVFRRRVRDAVFDLFPGLYENKEILIGSNVKVGFLGSAFCYAYRTYKKHENFSVNESTENGVPETVDVEVVLNEEEPINVNLVESDDTHDLDIELLTTALGTQDQDDDIRAALKNTVEMRRESILNGNFQFILDLFYRKPQYAAYDFELLWPDKTSAFLEKKEKIFSAINSIYAQNFGTTKSFVEKLDPLIQTYGKMMTLLYNCSERKLNELLLMIMCDVPENTSVADISALSANETQPFIVIRRSDPPEFIITCDGRLMPLPSTSTLDTSFDFLVKLHHVWHITYPSAVEKFYIVVDALSFMIGKPNPKSAKIMDLITRINAEISNEMRDEM